MAGSFKWHGPQFEAKILDGMNKNLAAASIAVWRHAKKLVNVKGTGKREKAGKKNKEGKRKRKGSLIYGANPSAPGEPPHKQMGRLLASIAWEVGKQVARVGTNLKYGRWLELGTKKTKARPWLRRALAEMKGKIARILCRPIKT